jgi:hypothetical protein
LRAQTAKEHDGLAASTAPSPPQHVQEVAAPGCRSRPRTGSGRSEPNPRGSDLRCRGRQDSAVSHPRFRRLIRRVLGCRERHRRTGRRMISCPNGHPNPASELFCRHCDTVMPPLTSAPQISDIRWSLPQAADSGADADIRMRDAPTTSEPRAFSSDDTDEPLDVTRFVPADVPPAEQQTEAVSRAVLMRAKRRPWWRRRRHRSTHALR